MFGSIEHVRVLRVCQHCYSLFYSACNHYSPFFCLLLDHEQRHFFYLFYLISKCNNSGVLTNCSTYFIIRTTAETWPLIVIERNFAHNLKRVYLYLICNFFGFEMRYVNICFNEKRGFIYLIVNCFAFEMHYNNFILIKKKIISLSDR